MSAACCTLKDAHFHPKNGLADQIIFHFIFLNCLNFTIILLLIVKCNILSIFSASCFRRENVKEMKFPSLHMITFHTKNWNYNFQLHSDDLIPTTVSIDEHVTLNDSSRTNSEYHVIATYHHLLPSPYDAHCFDYQNNYQDESQTISTRAKLYQ
jgi:hypothetical protein